MRQRGDESLRDALQRYRTTVRTEYACGSHLHRGGVEVNPVVIPAASDTPFHGERVGVDADGRSLHRERNRVTPPVVKFDRDAAPLARCGDVEHDMRTVH